ncbi:MAG: hypothetical protein AABZ08_00275 [Planctomycetota bacterium]|mgnify:CR=1 FL=1
MDLLIKLCTVLGDLAFAVLAPLPPSIQLVIISAVTGVLMLLIWRYTSNQKAIEHVRNQIAANLLAARLFKDSVRVSLRSQRRILWLAMRLLGLAIRPTLIMMVPFVLVMAQIGLRFEMRPAAVGDVIRVTATTYDTRARKRLPPKDYSLQLPAGLRADPNDPCRAETIRTIDWRLTPEQAGTYTLRFLAGQDVVDMPLIVGETMPRISKLRGGPWLDRLLYSAEASIPALSAFESIVIHYPTRSTPIFGFEVHWLIALFVLSIVFALVAKPILKVHI